MEVSADGPWTIRIDYPRPVTGVALPQVLTGSGEAIAAVIQHTGAAKFTMTHSGSSNFQVKGFDPVRGVDLFLANEIGAWSGVKVAAMSGVRIIHVNADGPWTIRIEKP